MMVIPGNAQHIGMRDQQEDAFGFSNIENAQFVASSGIMAVLADGMGGLAMGAEASQLAVSSVLDAYEARSPQEAIDESLFRVAHRANNAVKEYAYNIGQEHEMGTTLVAAVVHQDRLYWVSVGDSRIYLYRDGNMIQLNKDHVYGQELQEQVARGVISREEAESHPERDALTSYIGIPVLEKIDISHRPVQLKPGDKVLLCSDGLYRTLAKQEILVYLERDAQEACDAMIDAVLSRRRPYQDNTTLLVLEIEAGTQRSVPATTHLTSTSSRRTQGDVNYARMGGLTAGEEPQAIARPSMMPENLNYKRLGILVGSIVLLLTVLTVGVIFIKDRLGSTTTSSSTTSTTSDEDLVGSARVPGLAEFDFRSAGNTSNNNENSNSSSSNKNNSDSDQQNSEGTSTDTDSQNSDSTESSDSSNNNNSGDNNTGTNDASSNNDDTTNTGTNNSTGNQNNMQDTVTNQVENLPNQVPGNINVPSNPEDLF